MDKVELHICTAAAGPGRALLHLQDDMLDHPFLF